MSELRGVDGLSGVAGPVTASASPVIVHAAGVTVQMISVQEGAFLMGSAGDDDETFDREHPRHEVCLSGYQIGQTPVTQGLYQAIMGTNPSANPASDQHPVENVSWFDAVRFCNAMSRACGLEEVYTIGVGEQPEVTCNVDVHGFRLPTEAEWECAARAGQDFPYSGSEDPDEVAWFSGNSNGSTQPVAQKKPNAWGLYDMSGNVFEWCWDVLEEYAARVRASSELGARIINPTGAQRGGRRVLRGGVFVSAPRGLRVAYRDTYKPARRFKLVGFRVVLPEKQRAG